jgi:DNA-binding Lrp family transcriptional regulator
MKPATIRSKDLRKYSILPIRAVRDQRINRSAALTVLAAICGYTDELGRTFVSQARLASDLGISRQAVQRQIKKLFDTGYLVYARKQYKDQRTNTVKVKYEPDITSDKTSRSNLTAKEQMDLAEREAGLAGATLEVAAAKGQVQHQRLHTGATSEVDTPATPEVALNETLTSNNNDIKGDAKRIVKLFIDAAEAYGTPRIWNERDEQLAESWVRQGLTIQQWGQVVRDHCVYCQKNARDLARGLGYFSKPVSRALGSSSDQDTQKIISNVARSLRRV